MITRKSKSNKIKWNKTCKYKATKEDIYYLQKHKRGKSIGFTKISSLKAKGLIPRSSGKKIISAKYCN